MNTSGKPMVIVVCTYNRSRSLLETIRSIDRSEAAVTDAEIVVVLNNCTDDSELALTRYAVERAPDALPMRWIREPKAGKSHALNAAISQTTHPLLCFIDDDQTVEPGFVSALLAGEKCHPEDSILCGRIHPAWDGSEPAWVHAQAPYRIPIRPFPEFDLGDATQRIARDARFPSGGNIAVRRSVFEDVGLFNTELGPTGHNLFGGEDHEFLARATGRGHTIRYLPEMRQLHAIDPERMATWYTLRKSFLRSHASQIIHAPDQGVKSYMFAKLMSHLSKAVFTTNADRRFFYLVRAAAGAGELWCAARRRG